MATYEVKPVRAVLRDCQSGTVPLHIADLLYTLMNGPLGEYPRKLGGPLGKQYSGKWSAHLGPEWRAVYTIDDEQMRVTVTAVRRRADVYGI